MLSEKTHLWQMNQMQCRWGIQAAPFSLLMKAWCQSVFLVTLPRTHTHTRKTSPCIFHFLLRQRHQAVCWAWVWWLQLAITYWYSSCHPTLSSFFSRMVLRPQSLLRPDGGNRHIGCPFSNGSLCSSSRASTGVGLSVLFFRFCPCAPST